MHQAYVLAEVHIQGKPWVVARPMGMNPPSSSWAAPGDDFSVFFGDRDRLPAFGDFVGVLEAVVRGPFEKMKLPNAGRDCRWLDLLGWLSRDQGCRYRHHNEWRNPETESGTAQLKRDDASLLIRMAMDLLDDEERELMVIHAALRREQADLEEEASPSCRVSRTHREGTYPSTRTDRPAEGCNVWNVRRKRSGRQDKADGAAGRGDRCGR